MYEKVKEKENEVMVVDFHSHDKKNQMKSSKIVITPIENYVPM